MSPVVRPGTKQIASYGVVLLTVHKVVTFECIQHNGELSLFFVSTADDSLGRFHFAIVEESVQRNTNEQQNGQPSPETC